MAHFPHAVLELKLQLASDGVSTPEPPASVSELLTSGCLIDAPKFSKFVHGTAMLYQHTPVIDGHPPVRELPYWWAPAIRSMWDDFSDERHRSAKAKGEGGLKPSPNGSTHANGKWVGGELGGALAEMGTWWRQLAETVLTCGGQQPTCAMSTGRRHVVRTHQVTLGDAAPECCVRLPVFRISRSATGI